MTKPDDTVSITSGIPEPVGVVASEPAAPVETAAIEAVQSADTAAVETAERRSPTLPPLSLIHI